MFVLLVLIVSCIPTLNSCGISTHISIANQALQSFSDDKQYNVSYRNIILENFDAFYAGSTYPDAMYSSLCFDRYYHDVSEVTHWAPFLNASVNYVRRTFPQPWNKETRKLVAFVFGIVSHQVADITWHSLGFNQGFLQVMGKINFYGSYDTAHPIGDTGGDMVSMFEGDLQGVLSLESWYVPVGDLVNIYRELYGQTKISAAILFTCSEFLYIGALGEHFLGADLFPMYAKKSPFLVEELHSYFLGGKSDMAAWSSSIWSETAYMFEKGTAACEIPKSTLYLKCLPETRSLLTRTNSNIKNMRPMTSLVYLEDVRRMVITKHTSRGVYFSTKRTKNIEKKNPYDMTKNGERYEESDQLMFFTKNSYANLGWSLLTGELPLYNQALIASAPWFGNPGNSQHGRVYIVSSSKSYFQLHDIDIDKTADQILDGNAENGRFGFSVAVLDFNADGVNDLAISAPSEGSSKLNYTGKVYIHYGNTKYGINKTAGAVIVGDQHYYNLGTTLLGEDVDQDGFKDLIIGSKYAPMNGEQRGSVVVFFSGKKDVENVPEQYFVSQADIVFSGEQNYSWFGSHIVFHDDTSIGRLLIVSAPTFRICALENCSYSADDTQSVGKVYGYRWSNNRTAMLVFEITGHEALAKMGTSMAIGDPFGTGDNDILAVSSPSAAVEGYFPLDLATTFDQAGHVCLLNLTTLFYKRHIVLTKDDYITRFEGNRNYGRLGWHLSWQDINGDNIDDLVLGSPYYTRDTFEDNGGEQGAVYVFYGGTSFPRGDATSNCSLLNMEPCPEKKASQYFVSRQKYGQFGKDVVTMPTFGNQRSRCIIISSPRQNGFSLHNGAITVIQINYF